MRVSVAMMAVVVAVALAACVQAELLEVTCKQFSDNMGGDSICPTGQKRLAKGKDKVKCAVKDPPEGRSTNRRLRALKENHEEFQILNCTNTCCEGSGSEQLDTSKTTHSVAMAALYNYVVNIIKSNMGASEENVPVALYEYMRAAVTDPDKYKQNLDVAEDKLRELIGALGGEKASKTSRRLGVAAGIVANVGTLGILPVRNILSRKIGNSFVDSDGFEKTMYNLMVQLGLHIFQQEISPRNEVSAPLKALCSAVTEVQLKSKSKRATLQDEKPALNVDYLYSRYEKKITGDSTHEKALEAVCELPGTYQPDVVWFGEANGRLDEILDAFQKKENGKAYADYIDKHASVMDAFLIHSDIRDHAATEEAKKGDSDFTGKIEAELDTVNGEEQADGEHQEQQDDEQGGNANAEEQEQGEEHQPPATFLEMEKSRTLQSNVPPRVLHRPNNDATMSFREAQKWEKATPKGKVEDKKHFLGSHRFDADFKFWDDKLELADVRPISDLCTAEADQLFTADEALCRGLDNFMLAMAAINYEEFQRGGGYQRRMNRMMETVTRFLGVHLKFDAGTNDAEPNFQPCGYWATMCKPEPKPQNQWKECDYTQEGNCRQVCCDEEVKASTEDTKNSSSKHCGALQSVLDYNVLHLKGNGIRSAEALRKFKVGVGAFKKLLEVGAAAGGAAAGGPAGAAAAGAVAGVVNKGVDELVSFFGDQREAMKQLSRDMRMAFVKGLGSAFFRWHRSFSTCHPHNLIYEIYRLAWAPRDPAVATMYGGILLLRKLVVLEMGKTKFSFLAGARAATGGSTESIVSKRGPMADQFVLDRIAGWTFNSFTDEIQGGAASAYGSWNAMTESFRARGGGAAMLNTALSVGTYQANLEIDKLKEAYLEEHGEEAAENDDAARVQGISEAVTA